MYISLLSLIVRIINTDKKFNDFEEVKKGEHLVDGDKSKWGQVVKKGTYFKLPKELHKYVWYAGKKMNSKTLKDEYSLPSLVHNNGVLSWQGQF